LVRQPCQRLLLLPKVFEMRFPEFNDSGK
jgi:hypothetical protein